MLILGICCYYHDSSAALIKDGKVIIALQEERFTRKKHDTSFPKNSIDEILKNQNISINQIDAIAFYEKPILKFERLLSQYIDKYPFSYRTFLSSIPSWASDKLRVVKTIKKQLNYKKDIYFIEHHMAHAAGSFYPSKFKKAAILSIDGVGEWTTTAFGFGDENIITLEKDIEFPSSIGLLYSTITAYLGFSVNNSEYKVMGLSPYGDMNKSSNKFYERLRQVIDIKDDGSYCLDMNYFDYLHKLWMPSKKLCKLLDGDIREPEEEITQRHKDIAAAVQLITEEVFIKILNHVYNQIRSPNLVISGGVSLNSVANGKILKNTPFRKIWSQPDPGDGGTSIGAALYLYHAIYENKTRYPMNSAYLGNSYSNEEVEEFLKQNNIAYHKFNSEKEMIFRTSKFLKDNQVIGWFQGNMEWGPRALGCRSILSNPTNFDMKEILNVKVKHREKFRPFAPVVCYEDALKYFDCDKPIPDMTDFMLMVYPIKKKYHNLIPAVTHVDGSGRLQTIKRSQNKLYYDLIKEFGKLSGVPILINTSFNIRGEPIVCSPYDAYKCMMGTGIDMLVINKFLIKREENLQDGWDSEKVASD